MPTGAHCARAIRWWREGPAHIGVLGCSTAWGFAPTSSAAAWSDRRRNVRSGSADGIDSLARTPSMLTSFAPISPGAALPGCLQPLVIWEQGGKRFHLQSASVAETEVKRW